MLKQKNDALNHDVLVQRMRTIGEPFQWDYKVVAKAKKKSGTTHILPAHTGYRTAAVQQPGRFP